MKRLSLANPLMIAVVTGILLVSCTTSSSQPSTSYAEGYSLFGLEAAEYYGALLEKEETNIFRYNYAYSLFEAEDYSRALAEAKIGSEIYPEHIRFLYLGILAAEKLDDTISLVELNEKVLDLAPGNEMTINRLLSLYEENGNHLKAVSLAKDNLWILKDQSVALKVLSEESEFYRALLEEQHPEA